MTILTPSRFFWIGGSHKSGTTWIMQMLNSHPEIGVTGEAGFFGFEWGVRSWLDRDAFEKWQEEKVRRHTWLLGVDREELELAFQRSLVETLMRQRFANRKPPVQVYGDKTPFFYNVHSEEVHRLFPESRFLDVIRDGRDVMVSHMFHMMNLDYGVGSSRGGAKAQRRYYLEGKGRKVPLFTSRARHRLAKDWRGCILGGRRAEKLFGDAYLAVRYEDLLSDPDAELRRILRFLDVPHRPDLVDRCVSAHRFEAASGRERGAEDRTSFYRKGVAGDWRNHFTDEDRQEFKQICGQLLMELGYEQNDAW